MELAKMPEDIIGVIYEFLPITTLYTLNKNLFSLHYPTVLSTASATKFKSYVRNIIRNDYDFKLSHLLKLNYQKWNKQSSWKYKRHTFPSYMVFLKLLSTEYNSTRCRQLIDNYLKNDLSLSKKKKHKKIRHKNIKWSN